MNADSKTLLAVSTLLAITCGVPAFAEQYNLDHTIMRETGVAKRDESSGTIKRFSEAYRSKSSPKIAIFLNRTLSDDVREWKTAKRAVITGNGSVTASAETPLRIREETVKGPLAAYEQEYNGVEGARDNVEESYIWSFEDGFIQPYLKAGTILVDRATILRLLSRNANQGAANEVIETKKNEMDALVNNADIYIEILVTKYPTALTGYEFKAVAKEVKTGRILASATSLNWDNQERPKKVITTDQGYKVVDDPKMPKVQTVSKDLAVDLMNSLLSTWSAGH